MAKPSLFQPTPRSDDALIAGDVTSGQQAGAVPLRTPLERPSTLGNGNAPARIVADMVSGMPNVADNPAPPALGIIEKVADTRTQLPRREGGDP